MKIRCLLLLLAGLLLNTYYAAAQENAVSPDHIYFNNIKSVKFHPPGDPLSLPVITRGAGEQLELSFDDMDNDTKNYYFSFVLCNADWSRAQVNTLDYLQGFSENRIQNYRFSSIALQKYTHYSVAVPAPNSVPKKAGNYLLMVYLDSDTTQLAFTRRMLVVDNKAGVSGYIQQPVSPKLFRTSQKINFSINTGGLNINNPFDQVKVYILQNYRWDNAIHSIKPMFLRGNEIVYNTEVDCVFPAMKEWRWVDLRSFRLQTERVDRSDYRRNGTDIYVKPDPERGNSIYQYIKDINGRYQLATLDDYDPNFEGDYAAVHFTYPSKEPYAGYDMYIFGELTSYECNESNKMVYNPSRGAYEGTLFLKQGFYNYIYGLIDKTVPNSKFNTEYTEGNYWEAENNYTILIYFRPLGGRSDELVGMATLNSMLNRSK
ncbi:MAG TPA: DUF5103 domain-containing protein [Chitinophaga sp.]